MNNLPTRKQIRLKNYDYSQNGCYFVTVCVKDKKHLLGHFRSKDEVVGAGLRARPRDAVVLTKLGREVESSIIFIGEKYSNVSIEYYVILPNHVHLLILISDYDERLDVVCTTGGRGDPPLQSIIGYFKSYTTTKFRKIGNNHGILWQRSFYDRVIRNQLEFEKAWEYIEYNALKEYGK